MVEETVREIGGNTLEFRERASPGGKRSVQKEGDGLFDSSGRKKFKGKRGGKFSRVREVYFPYSVDKMERGP